MTTTIPRTAAIGALALALVLSGCTGQSRVKEGSAIAVAQSQRFTSYNDSTSFGSNPGANGGIVDATNSSFFSYDEDLELVPDESFGTVAVDSEDPLTVTYTLSDRATWSDGERVGAADLLLAWAANSGALDTPGFDDTPYLDTDTNLYAEDFPDDVVFFDGSSGGGLDLVTTTPTVGGDGRSITLRFDRYFADWRLVFDVGVPAHVVGMNALGIEDAAEAADAVGEAVLERDIRLLGPVARFWNSGFNLGGPTDDPSLLVGSGPYMVTEVAADHATLEANPRYRGERTPSFETVTVRYFADPLEAVAALEDGTVDAISPRPTADAARALRALDDVTVVGGSDGAFERLDLQRSNSRSGIFDDPLVREAFLHVVPRREILDRLIVPVQADAEARDSFLLPPGARGYENAVAANGSDRFAAVDVAAARRLLVEAGVSSPEVCVLFDPSNAQRVTEFELIRASAATAGFRVTDCSSPGWLDLLGVPGRYDASLYALRATNLAVSSARAAYAVDGANNTNFFTDPAASTLLERLDLTRDPDDQEEILRRIDAAAWADASSLPLYQLPSLTAFGSRVDGVPPTALSSGLLANVWQWTPRDRR